MEGSCLYIYLYLINIELDIYNNLLFVFYEINNSISNLYII